MSTFINSLRSETTKLLSMRSTVVYLVLLAGSLFGPVVLSLWLGGNTDTSADWGMLTTGAIIFQVVAIVFAAATTAGDIRNHMHAQAFLTQSGRWQWVSAKVLVTVVFTTVAFVLGLVVGILAAFVFGAGVDLGTEVNQLVVNLVFSVLISAMCVGLACLIRSQVGAVAVPIAWMMVIDGMLGMAAQSIDAFRPLAVIAPGQRQAQLLYGEDPLGLGVSDAMCWVIIVGWLVVLTGLGLWRNQRADVR